MPKKDGFITMILTVTPQVRDHFKKAAKTASKDRGYRVSMRQLFTEIVLALPVDPSTTKPTADGTSN